MNDRRPLIVTGLVLLLIILLIGGVIFYLINFIRGRQATEQATRDLFPRSSASIVIGSPSPTTSTSPNRSLTPVATAAPSAVVSNTITPPPVAQPSAAVSTSGNFKTVTVSGFKLNVPKTWGVLTCTNSQNFEFDPYNSSNVSANCVKAIRPITVLVGKNSCVGGQIVTLGTIKARKVVDTSFTTRDGNGVQYQWCTQTTPSLDITQRVGFGTAFSADDFSTAVEQMIATFTPGS